MVTRQLQVERTTWKVRQSKIDVKDRRSTTVPRNKLVSQCCRAFLAVS